MICIKCNRVAAGRPHSSMICRECRDGTRPPQASYSPGTWAPPPAGIVVEMPEALLCRLREISSRCGLTVGAFVRQAVELHMGGALHSGAPSCLQS